MPADGSPGHDIGPETVGPASNLIVMVDRSGAFLAARGQVPAYRLGLADLRGLASVARGEPWPDGTDPGLVDAVAADGLVPGVGSWPTSSSDAEPRPDVADDRYLGKFVLFTPTALRLGGGRFELLDHDGHALLRLDPVELLALTAYGVPRDDDAAHELHRGELGEKALDRATFDRLARQAEWVGLVGRAGEDGEDTAEGKLIRAYRQSFGQSMQRAVYMDSVLVDHRPAAASAGAPAPGGGHVPVVPVTNGDVPLLSLGLVMSFAQAYEDGRLTSTYDFVPDWMNRTIPSLQGDESPMVFLFSNYLWSHRWNLGASAEVKAKDRRHVTIHGGPDTPKYESDVDEYFRANPHVDINVHGEGEITLAEVLAALEPSLRAGAPDLSVLADVAGISYRDGDRIVRTIDRDRIADLDIIPSPFDNGLFDSVGDFGLPYLIIETNRGCPYGCTYCDWGSATLSRIRKFDLDRVFADLEWAARNHVEVIWNADANFGVFARDVEIASKVVDLKRTYGYPRLFGANYAKNTVKHLRLIVDTLVEGGILATGVLSMQSADDQTLLTIRRQNIKVDRYDDLAEEFSRNELPLVTELMMGLPGSTKRSFSADLQQCVDREMRARVYPTELLVNSPMNEPAYRELHRIETVHAIKETWRPADGAGRTAPFVVATATFSREEYRQMDRFRQHFFLFENYGVLRQVSRFVRQEAGIAEMELYGQMEDAVVADRTRWPTLAFVFGSMHDHLVAPASWRRFIDEVRSYLTDVVGLADDSALETVLAVQHALLPAPDRRFPFEVAVAHDFAAWHARMIGLKLGGHSQDWADLAPRLATYGPSSFEVSDPQSVCAEGMGEPLLSSNEADWEMRSPVSRTLTFLQTVG